MNRIMILCAAFIVSTILPVAADTARVNGIEWTYTVSNGEASLGGGSSSSTAVPDSTEGTLSIPSVLGGKPVTSIGSSAFYNCSGLTSVTIPDSVTSIGDSAFDGCSGLTSVTIPNSVMSIGAGAFSGCSGLEGITLPFVGARRGNGGISSLFGYIFGTSSYTGGTLTVQQYSFSFDKEEWIDFYIPSALKTVVVTDETVLGNGAFYGCDGLTSVMIPNSVTSIGFYAFYDCGLTSVTIPDSVTSIGYYAFSGCSGLTSVTISDGVKSIGGSAFEGCSGLTSVTIPDGVKSIGARAFEGCSGLTSVTIPDSVTSIGECAFEGCSGLTSVRMKDDCPDVGSYAFNGVKNDCIVYLPKGNATYVVSDGKWQGMVVEYYEPAPANPVFYHASGTTFDSSLSVSMSCPTEGATIHYTTDGSDPTAESPVYKRFKIYGKTTVKAVAVKDGMLSEVVTAEYALGQCADPVFSLVDGSEFEHSNQEVSIAWNNDGVLRYTLDGSEPTAESPIYEGPFSFSESVVVKAKVFSDDFFDSSVVTASLTRVWVNVAAPVVDAASSFTGSKTKVSISCATEGAVVRYTLNGNEPNSHSTKYTGPFYVTDSCTVKAYAVMPDYLNSDWSFTIFR